MKKITLLFFILLLCSVFVLATNCPPSLPKTYQGTVFYDGSLLTGSYEIRAVMVADTVGIDNVTGGTYEIDVSPCSGITGEVIFIIGGIEAREKGSYFGIDDWGKEVNLNLTLNEAPLSGLCGNGVIDLGEECDGDNLAGRNVNDCGENWEGTIYCSSTCQIDYLNCVYNPPSPPSEGSSGGDSGGSSSGGGGSASDANSGSSSSITEMPNNTIYLNTEKENESIDLNNENQKKSSGITGAVIGFLGSGTGIVTIIVLIILGIGVVLILKNKSLK